MKRLVLMRHAKSAWDTKASTDHGRPLNDRGRRQAPEVAQRLRDLGWIPDLVLSSDSTRTQQTWDLVGPVLSQEPIATRFEESLYLAGPDELLRLLAQVPESVTTVLALGHNPGWQDTLQLWSGADLEMKTSCAALLQADGSWSDLASRPMFRCVQMVAPGGD